MAMAALPYIIAAVAAAVSAASDYMSSSAQINGQIDAEKYNRDLLRRQASNEGLVASLNEDAQRREAAFVQSRTRAGLIEAGIGTAKGGSAVAVSGQASKFAELDALNIRWEGDMQRTALLSQADLTQYEIEGLRGQRKAARTSAVMEGVKGVAAAYAGYAGGGGGMLQKAPAGTGTSMPKTPTGTAGSRPVGLSGIGATAARQRSQARFSSPTAYQPRLA